MGPARISRPGSDRHAPAQMGICAPASLCYDLCMIFRRYGTFTGGIDLPDEKRPTLALPITAAARPGRLLVPLGPCAGAPAEALVKPGEPVRAGQRIGAAGPGGVDIFAPLDGRVRGLTRARVARWGGFADTPAVELTDLSDPRKTLPPRSGGAEDEAPAGAKAPGWPSEDLDELRARLVEGHICTHRPAPAPLARFVARARDARCRWAILNVMDHEPQVSSDHRLLAEYGPAVMEGLAILARLVGARQTVLAADRRRTAYYDSCDAPAGRFGITRIALPHKYPMGSETILAKVVTRREAPPGAGAIAVGAAVFDAPTCLAVQQWIVRGRRMLGRVVTVAGPHTGKPGNFWTPFGTLCAELGMLTAGASSVPSGGSEPALIHGGPMAGSLCDADAVVTPASAAVLSIPAEPMPLPSPCLRCGWCTDHCPARLNVAMLNDAFELSLVDRAERGGALACVECGVCSYVCPAKLPLTQRVKRLKRRIASLRAPAGAPAPGGGRT